LRCPNYHQFLGFGRSIWYAEPTYERLKNHVDLRGGESVRNATYLFLIWAIIATVGAEQASGQLLYSFEEDEEDWIPTTVVSDFDDNEAVVTSVAGVGNTHGSRSLKVEGRTGDYVRTTQVTLDPDRVELMNAAWEEGWNLEFDWTIVASENPGAQRYWTQLALNTSAGWTQLDMFAPDGWPEWDPNGPEVQTITASIPLMDFGMDRPFCCGLALDGLATSYSIHIAMGGGNEPGEIRTYYLDNFRLVDPDVVPTPGDFNGDNVLTVADIDLLTTAVKDNSTDRKFDVNGDGAVSSIDRTDWVQNLKRTYFGDSNLDGEFNSTDFVVVFTAGQYEDGIPRNSTWTTGDWDGTCDFDSSDFVTAFTAAGYEKGPRAAVNAVPEPGCLALCALGLFAMAARRFGRG
jgi:hypothetical protein